MIKKIIDIIATILIIIIIIILIIITCKTIYDKHVEDIQPSRNDIIMIYAKGGAKMLKISGRFKSEGIQEFSSRKKISLTNGEKDKDGKYNQTYYDLWINDKVSNMINPDLKREIANKKAILNITGYLLVKRNDKYTNLIIYPSSIKKYSKPDF